jgi:hypothetical protein
VELSERIITRAIIERYSAKLLSCLDLDVAVVGAGPAGLVAAHDLAKARLAPHTYETLVIGEFSYLSTRLVGPPTARVYSLAGNCTGLKAPQPGITRSGHRETPSQPGFAGVRPRTLSRFDAESFNCCMQPFIALGEYGHV